MGTTQSIGMAEAVNDGLTDLYSALRYQLFSNHFPPLPEEALSLSFRAIRLWKGGFYKATVDISSIGSHGRLGTQVPITTLLENWHLWHFVDQEDLENIWDFEYNDAEEVEADEFYDRAVAVTAELYSAGAIAEEYQHNNERVLQILIGYCGGYSDNPPADLAGFGFVTSREAADTAWNKVKEGENG